MTMNERPPTTYAEIVDRIAHLESFLPEAQRLAESHPYQFAWIDVPLVRRQASQRRPSTPLVIEEVRAWLDEHAPGWIAIENKVTQSRIGIADPNDAFAFKMRWL